MRWLTYFILAYLIIALQLALSGFLNWGSAVPNLVLPAVVFVAINARREEALLGVFILGLLQDLFTQRQPGLYAFSYALVGLFVVGARPSLYRDHPLTHFFVTLATGLLTGLVVLFNDWAYPRLHPTAVAAEASLMAMIGGAIYTAMIAPVMLVVLVKGKGLFGFRGVRGHGSMVG